MKIRKAKNSDAKKALEIAMDEAEKEGYIGLSLADFKAAPLNKNAIYLVAEEKGVVLGFVIGYINPVLTNEAVLQETHVHMPHRGKGIGSKLVDAFCKEAKKRRVKSIIAYVGDERLSFYTNKGFEKAKIQYLELDKRL